MNYKRFVFFNDVSKCTQSIPFKFNHNDVNVQAISSEKYPYKDLHHLTTSNHSDDVAASASQPHPSLYHLPMLLILLNLHPFHLASLRQMPLSGPQHMQSQWWYHDKLLRNPDSPDAYW